LDMELDRKRNELTESLETEETLRSELVQRDTEIKDFRNKNVDLVKQLENLLDMKKLADETNSSLRDEIVKMTIEKDDSKKRLSAVEMDMSTKVRELADARSMLEEERKLRKRVKESLTIAEERIESLSRSKMQVVEQFDPMKKKIDELTHQRLQLLKEVEAMKGRHEDNVKHKSELEERIRQLREDVKRQRARGDRLEREVAEEQEKLREKGKTLVGHEIRVAREAAIKTNLIEQVTSMARYIESLRSDLDVVRAREDTANFSLSSLQSKIKHLESSLHAAEEEKERTAAAVEQAMLDAQHKEERFKHKLRRLSLTGADGLIGSLPTDPAARRALTISRALKALNVVGVDELEGYAMEERRGRPVKESGERYPSSMRERLDGWKEEEYGEGEVEAKEKKEGEEDGKEGEKEKEKKEENEKEEGAADGTPNKSRGEGEAQASVRDAQTGRSVRSSQHSASIRSKRSLYEAGVGDMPVTTPVEELYLRTMEREKELLLENNRIIRKKLEEVEKECNASRTTIKRMTTELDGVHKRQARPSRGVQVEIIPDASAADGFRHLTIVDVDLPADTASSTSAGSTSVTPSTPKSAKKGKWGKARTKLMTVAAFGKAESQKSM